MLSFFLVTAHLFGDYVLQSHTMALYKKTSWKWALLHSLFYGAPHALLMGAYGLLGTWVGWCALATIILTHAPIDRLSLAARWCRWFGVGFPGLWSRDPNFETPPPFLGVWLIILVDNAMHLLINGLAVATALNWS